MPLGERENDLPRLSPPENAEAEEGLLGTLLSYRNTIDRVSATLRPEHFADELRARIYEVILRLTSTGGVADPVTLSNLFPEQKRYLARLAASASIVANAAHYAKVIIDLWHRRELMMFHYEGYQSAALPEIDQGGKELLEAAEQGLFRIGEEAGDSGKISTAGGAARVAIEQAELAHKAGGKIVGLPTGIHELDRLIGGLQNKNLIVMASRPAMGKTALSGSIITNIARHLIRQTPENERLRHILFFSQEMPSEQIAQRDIARFTGIPSERLSCGDLGDREWMLIHQAQEMLDTLPVLIDETGQISVSYVRQVARRVKRQKGLALIFIDHLQKMRQGKSENRRLEIGEITGQLAALAKDLDIPIVLLSQLSRALEMRDDKRPMLSDLRESGDIEQDADVVLFIHRDEYYLERDEPTRGANETPQKFSDKHEKWNTRMGEVHNLAELLVPKVRQGRTGKVTTFFDGARYLFDNYQRGGNGQ